MAALLDGHFYCLYLCFPGRWRPAPQRCLVRGIGMCRFPFLCVDLCKTCVILVFPLRARFSLFFPLAILCRGYNFASSS